MTVAAHCLVKNEARFIWYAVMSVIEHVDKVLLWDTGSTDGTLEIIEEIKKVGKSKVNFREYGTVDANTFTKARQDMLDQTDTEWFIIVDGDEIWWEESIKQVVQVVKSLPAQAGRGSRIESIVVPTINLIGDMFHYQEGAAGQYCLAGRIGHFNLRVINRSIPGLHSKNPHGTWGWADEEGNMIQDRDPEKIFFVDAPYMHASFLPRSLSRERDLLVPKRVHKLKYELGKPFQKDFYYPEVFFGKRPNFVPSVWFTYDANYTLRAAFETPFKKIRRRIGIKTVGY